MSPFSRNTAVGLAAGLALVLTACSGGTATPNDTANPTPTDTANPTPTDTANPTPTDTPAATGTVVTVSETEFAIALGSPVTTAGAYEFVVENHGGTTHDLVIEGPGLSGSHTSSISAGGTSTLDVTLEAGTYTLYCSIGGHRASGMETTITVG